MSVKGIVVRSVLSLGAIVALRATNSMFEMTSPLITGPIAAQQLNGGAKEYLETAIASNIFNGSGLFEMVTGLIFMAVLAVIWYKPISKIFE